MGLFSKAKSLIDSYIHKYSNNTHIQTASIKIQETIDLIEKFKSIYKSSVDRKRKLTQLNSMFNRLEKLYPDSTYLRLLECELLELKDESYEIKEILIEFYNYPVTPYSVEILKMIGKCNLLIGNLNKALKIYRSVKGIDPTCKSNKTKNISLLIAEMKDCEKVASIDAMKGIAKYTALLTTNKLVMKYRKIRIELISKRAQIYYKLKKYDNCIEDCNLVLEVDEYDSCVNYYKYLCYFDQKDYSKYEEAIEVLDEVNNMDDDNDYYDYINELLIKMQSEMRRRKINEEHHQQQQRQQYFNNNSKGRNNNSSSNRRMEEENNSKKPKDYYELLGIKREASEDEIRKAYMKLAKKWHPDRHSSESEEEQKAATEKFKEISQAYSVLSDPEKRQHYDMYGDDDEETSEQFNNVSLDELMMMMFGMNLFGGGGFGGGRRRGGFQREMSPLDILFGMGGMGMGGMGFGGMGMGFGGMGFDYDDDDDDEGDFIYVGDDDDYF